MKEILDSVNWSVSGATYEDDTLIKWLGYRP